MIELPTRLDYPIVAIGDLHGQHDEFARLIKALEGLPEWPDCSLVFLGKLSASPLADPGKVQVTGHERVSKPDANDVRIRLDTSGGFSKLTACLLRAAEGEPVFVTSG